MLANISSSYDPKKKARAPTHARAHTHIWRFSVSSIPVHSKRSSDRPPVIGFRVSLGWRLESVRIRTRSQGALLVRIRPYFPRNSPVRPLSAWPEATIRSLRSSTNHLANLSASIHTRLIFTQHQERKEKLTSCLLASGTVGCFFT
jgi:hypothetical protein